MVTISQINDFLEPKKMAFIGLSRDPKKFSRLVYKDLSEKNFDIYPVNPNTEKIEEINCYKNINDLPQNIDRAYIVTPKNQTKNVVAKLYEKGIKNIWIQQSAETQKAIDFANKNNMNCIHGKCIFMFVEPVKSVHAFHRFLLKLFNKYPK